MMSKELTTQEAYFFCTDVLKGRSEELEKIIMQDAFTSYNYASYVIKGRWYEAEEVIASCPHSAFLYAFYVLKVRWRLGESAIKTKPFLFQRYLSLPKAESYE